MRFSRVSVCTLALTSSISLLAVLMLLKLDTVSVTERGIKEELEGPGAIEEDIGWVNASEERREPMVLSLVYWEQSANGLKNILDLQCWSSSVGLQKVAEPVASNLSVSVFGYHLGTALFPRFGDLFDFAHWNDISMQRNYSHLVSMDDFLEHAVKDVLYVHIIYKQCVDEECPTIDDVAGKVWYFFLKRAGFRVVKVVCIDFYRLPSHSLGEAAFRESIFQNPSPGMSVVFNEWRGIRGDRRVALNGSKCVSTLERTIPIHLVEEEPKLSRYNIILADKSYYTFPLLPSRKIYDCVRKFIQEHLSGVQYVAVMLRTEKLHHKGKSVLTPPPENNSCIAGVVSDWKEMKKTRPNMETLFFADIGRYGSVRWSNDDAERLANHIQEELSPFLSLKTVNSLLKDMIGSGHHVLIAHLQQQLAAHANCVLMVGWGAFQAHTLSIHAHLHRDLQCYAIRDASCQRKFVAHNEHQRKKR